MTAKNSVGLSDGSDAYARQAETPNDTINSTPALIDKIRDWHSDVPAPMRDAHRWLVWRREPNATPGKKPRKVPYYPNGQHRSGELDTPEDIANLGTFDEALSILATGRYSGLGFALGPDGTSQYWQGIDLDGTTTRPELAQLADDLPGYTEDSPSQNGQHAIGYGRLFTALGSNRSGIEAYCEKRFFTVTAERAGVGAIICLADYVEQVLAPRHNSSTPTAMAVMTNAASVGVSNQIIADLRSALNSLPSDERGEWVRIGLALKPLGNIGRGLWFEWSAKSIKFDPADAARAWDSFKPSQTGYRAVFATAQAAGWRNPRSNAAKEWLEQNDWPPLVRLDHPILPRLRGDALPGWAGDFATAIAAATETPIELAVAMVLATCATATARRFKVMIKYGYFEPTNLWLAVALDPGNRKSAVQSAATAAVVKWERKQAEKMEDEITKATSDFKTAEARANKLRADAAKEKDGLKSTNLARQAADIEAAMPVIPHPPQLWTSDVTPERLGTILADNDERMAWLSSEGGIFEMLGGRYSKGIPNLDLVLKAHSGDSERVDRGSRPPVYLLSPLLTIGLSPQPDVLRGLATMPGFRGRGLLARFLYLLPPSPLGYRTGNPPPISEDIEDVFAKGITAILNIPIERDADGKVNTHILKLSPAAYEEWRAYGQFIEAAMRPGGEFESAQDWAGKAPGAAIRIAGVLHVMTHIEPWSSLIDLQTMTLALNLMAVFGKHSLAALDLMGSDKGITAASKIWRWIETGHRNEVSLRDIHQALKGSFPHAADVKSAIDVLVERGYVEITKVEAKTTGRHPSPIVIIRPDIVEGWS